MWCSSRLGHPEVLAVGGLGKSWTPVGFLYGAGGGFSALFNRPDYQKGVVPCVIPAGAGAAPDVAMDADPTTGMLVGPDPDIPGWGASYTASTGSAAPAWPRHFSPE